MQPVMIERSITTRAPRERVWNAITKPHNLSKWLAPLTMQFDRLVVGEVITFDFDQTKNQGSIAIVEPPECFAYRWKAHPDYDVLTTVSFTLTETAEGTHITIREEGFEALPAQARQARIDLNGKGWGIVLERIVEDLHETSHS